MEFDAPSNNLDSNILPFRPQASAGAPRLLPHDFSGSVSGPMWEKVSKLGSRYPDSFDYGMYDRLYEYFGKNQPWRGVVFKTTLKVVNWHVSCAQCHYSFELDTYGRGCIHDCIYCYAKDQLTRRGIWNRPIPFPIDIAELRKIFFTVFETDRPSKWRNIMGQRVPLRIGSMSDSFMGMDRRYKVTQELLKILSFYDYPYIVFTRGDLVAEEPYISLIRKDLASVQMSVSGDNEHLTRMMEPGAPSVKRRLTALRKLGEAGIWTTVRINPIFPTYPDGYFTARKDVLKRFGTLSRIPKFDLLDIDNLSPLIEKLVENKVPSLLAGFVRLSQQAVNRIKENTNIDFSQFFAPDAMNARGDKRYSDNEIAFYYTKLNSELSKAGIRFNTCYIGNGEKDFYQYQKLWSNKKDCCDARGNVPGISASSQDIPWSERFRHLRGPGARECAEKAQTEAARVKMEFDRANAPEEKH